MGELDRDQSRKFDELAEFILDSWDRARDMNVEPYYTKEILNDLLFAEDYPPFPSKLPESFFTYIFNHSNKGLQQAFFQLIEVYVRTNDSHILLLRKGYKETQLDLSQLRKHPNASKEFRELLVISMVRNKYYETRNYRQVIRMIDAVFSSIRNDLTKEELHYLRVLCLFHLQQYDEFAVGVDWLKNTVASEKGRVRLGRLLLLLGDIRLASESYIKVAQQRQDLQAALNAVYSLSVIMGSVKKGLPEHFLPPLNILENDINQYISQHEQEHIVNQPQGRIRQGNRKIHDAVYNRQQTVSKRERTNSSGFDNYMYEGFIACKELLKFTEDIGLPDVLISKSAAVKNLFTLQVEEGYYAEWLQLESFGISIDESVITAPPVYVFHSMKKSVDQLPMLIDFIKTNRKHWYDEWLPTFILDQKMKLLLRGMSYFNVEEQQSLIEWSYDVLNMKIASINNQINETCHRIIVRGINNLSSALSLSLFERYLQYLLKHPHDFHHRLGLIQFHWDDEQFKTFDYSLLKQLLKKINEVGFHRESVLFQVIKIIHEIKPIPEEIKSSLILELGKLGEKMERDNSFLKGLLLQLKGESVERDENVRDLYEQYMGDQSNSTYLGNPLYAIADNLSAFQRSELAGLLWKLRKDLHRLGRRSKQIFLDGAIARQFYEAYSHIFAALAAFQKKPLYLKWLIRFLSQSLPLIQGSAIKKVVDQIDSNYLEDISHYLTAAIKGSLEADRISIIVFSRSWLYVRKEWGRADQALHQIMTNQIYDTSPKLKELALSVISERSYWQKYEESQKLQTNILFESLSFIRKWPLQELNEQLLMQIAYFVHTYRLEFEKSDSRLYQVILDELAELGLASVESILVKQGDGYLASFQS